ncbi:putative acyl-CoA oxidase [Heterostelium album PN500]|uniref:Acyl-coenzyme A oxidase n=1 Tax=Heterostelium pallidum (strain ATCC 26659 / Pp 5 / PN500) TaxID=670386 RepID=D3BSZ9_HETP5|nr:putative acyl-CoA oxidase [Heterostelium album PN500]EFA75614.1 putative acyl-CoA oxidase [Heterostelium album PN500]|eukprot:XP_020427748.1 putative acyl-CoA oxidase [Heterostelium album PN500]
MEQNYDRIKSIIAHLLPLEISNTNASVDAAPAITAEKPRAQIPKWNKDELRDYLESNPSYKQVKQNLQNFLKDPIFAPKYNMNCEQWREVTLQRSIKVINSGLISLAEFNRDPMKYLLSMELLNLSDPSLSVKLGVHFSLFGNAVLNLGTEKHHLKYIKDIDTWKLPGCFGMTELGHGSNVQGVETTATYDKDTQEFIINTPSDSAQKFWIGNAALHGQACAVFAQLYIGGVHYGVHVFVVPIRNADGSTATNVRIMDNGYKLGLQGVDNGRLWFDNKRIPRDNLLNKFGDVMPDGSYVTSIPSKNKRFGSMVAPLVGGRVLIASSALNAAKLSLIIAIRYAYARRQFGSKGNEIPIIQYLTHQRRLFPLIAATVALNFPVLQLKQIYCEPNKTPQNVKDVHIWASGLKAVVSWHKTHTLQQVRECCGGQGFSAFNQIATLKSDLEIDMTYEGDNHVLLQQVAKNLLVELQKGRYTVTLPNHGVKIQNSDFQIQCFKWRESHLVQTLSSKIMSALDVGVGLEHSWNDNLDVITALGKAYIERITLEYFQAAIKKASANLQPVLELCRNLYFSSRVENDLGFFLCNDGLTHETGLKIQESVNKLCGDMLPVALDIVNSFDIPEQFVHAPIAKPDYIQEFRYGLERNY